MSVISFKVDRSTHLGILRFPHETTIFHDTDTKEWSGEEINSDGWVDLDHDEVMKIVDEYNLKSHIP